MGFLKNLLSKKESSINSYSDFWNWFQKNEREFYTVVKNKGDIEKLFFNKLSPKLNELKEGIFYLTGMYNNETVELVLTPDGTIKNIVFAEELVNAAPEINGWKFTALKPEIDNIESISLEMSGYTFNGNNIWFYENDNPDYPDEIDITVIHADCNEDNKKTITNGLYIFLDNYLGELNFVSTIDVLKVETKTNAAKDLIPIEKLKEFLLWRQKEFIEKYDGVRHNTDNDNYSLLEAQLNNGYSLVAVINTDLLDWDKKASHPWILSVEIKYSGEHNNGMPDEKTSATLLTIEDKISKELKDYDGYLNVGRETASNVREIYFACKDFRKPSKVVHEIISKYSNEFELNYDIYKDKYWRSLNRYK